MVAPPATATALPHQLDAIVEASRDGCWLDVGAGGGSTIDPESSLHVRDLPARVIVEADLYPRGAAAGVPRVVCSFEAGLPFADGSFDGVSCMHVLEHVAAPDALLAEVHRVLRPGGHLLAAVPNGRAWSDRMFRAWFRCSQPFGREPGAAHIQRFTRASFLASLANADLRPHWVAPMQEAFSWLHKHRHARRLATRAFDAMQERFGDSFRYGWYVAAQRG